MKPAPAWIQPSNALCIPEKAPRIFPVRGSLSALVRRKQTVVKISFSPRNLPVHAFDSRARGFSTPLARRQSSCTPPSPNLVRTNPIERYQALSATVLPASRVPPLRPPEGHENGARKRRAPGEHHPQPTIPPPRLNRSAESRRQPVGCISQG